MTEKRCICLQLEEYIADNMIELCEKRGISKYRLAQMTGIAQSSLGRIMAKVCHLCLRLRKSVKLWT